METTYDKMGNCNCKKTKIPPTGAWIPKVQLFDFL